jgi:hypothetical protein
LRVFIGCPQGTVISPILFLILINSLLKQCPSLFKIAFADNGTLLFTIDPSYLVRDVGELNSMLSIISNWFRTFKLLVNGSKSQAVRFRTAQRRINEDEIIILFDGVRLPLRDNMSCLGLLLHKNLNWTLQIDSFISRCNGVVASLFRLRSSGIPLHGLIQIYKQLFLPYITYMAPIWGSTSEQNLSRLQVVQNNALRSILGLRRSESVRIFYNKFSLMRVKGLIRYLTAIYAYKNFSKYYEPEVSFDYDTPCPRSRRHIHVLSKPVTKLIITENSVYYRVAEVWNDISSEIRGSVSLDIFKRKLTAKILSSQLATDLLVL